MKCGKRDIEFRFILEGVMFVVQLYTKCYFPVSRAKKILMADKCFRSLFTKHYYNRKSRVFFGVAVAMRLSKTQIDSACVALASKFDKGAVF
jgi:hypothetical protein